MNKFKGYNIILASQSPRRKTLLEGLGIKFNVIRIPDSDETYPAYLDKFQIPIYLSDRKSQSFGQLNNKDILITADTIVWMDNHVINKPADYKEAHDILHRISGNKHEVITGVTVRTIYEKHSFYSHTEVFFTQLNDEEIDYYISNFKPYDKAGAYGIQEWIGYIGIEKINGSYFNVMGLPVQQLYGVLKNIKI